MECSARPPGYRLTSENRRTARPAEELLVNSSLAIMGIPLNVLHTHAHAHTHTYIHTYTYIYTHIHTLIHTYIHSYKHTHTYIINCIGSVLADYSSVTRCIPLWDKPRCNGFPSWPLTPCCNNKMVYFIIDQSGLV